MGSIVSNIYDEINLHGSWEAYVEFRDIDLKKVEPLPDHGDIPYFPDPEVVPNTAGTITTFNMLGEISDWLKKETAQAWKTKMETTMRFDRTKSGKNQF